jgi:hypothetical protein
MGRQRKSFLKVYGNRRAVSFGRIAVAVKRDAKSTRKSSGQWKCAVKNIGAVEARAAAHKRRNRERD